MTQSFRLVFRAPRNPGAPGSVSPQPEPGSAPGFGIINLTGLIVQNLEGTDAEGDTTTQFVFNISRTGNTVGGCRFDWSVSGTGENPTDTDDFAAGSTLGSVSMGDGQSAVSVSVLVSKDTTFEQDETFVFTLSNFSGCVPGDSVQATGTITNDDAPSFADTVGLLEFYRDANEQSVGELGLRQVGEHSLLWDAAVVAGGTYDTQETLDALFTDFQDGKPAVIVFKGSTTIDAGMLLKTVARKPQVGILVDGDLTLNGEISMSGRGANTGPSGAELPQLDWVVATGVFAEFTDPTIPALGGSGGARRFSNGGSNDGADGPAFGHGGGGSGRYIVNLEPDGVADWAGAGSQGHWAGGGSGGGGKRSATDTPGGDAEPFGGAGGTAGDVASTSDSGGAGNPPGANGSADGDGTALSFGGGGTLVLVVKGQLLGDGVISSVGGAGRPATGGGTGGGAGGGVIVVFAEDDQSTVTLDASGGQAAGGAKGGDGFAEILPYPAGASMPGRDFYVSAEGDSANSGLVQTSPARLEDFAVGGNKYDLTHRYDRIRLLDHEGPFHYQGRGLTFDKHRVSVQAATGHKPIIDGSFPELLTGITSRLFTANRRDISHADWTKTGGTVAASPIEDPEGNTRAHRFTDDGADSEHSISRTVSATGGVASEIAVRHIPGSSITHILAEIETTGDNLSVYFDILDGHVVGFEGHDIAYIEPDFNGWWRIGIRHLTGSDGSHTVRWRAMNAETGNTWGGDGSSVDLYDPQFGSYVKAWEPYYPTGVTPHFEDDFNYTNEAAFDAVWTKTNTTYVSASGTAVTLERDGTNANTLTKTWTDLNAGSPYRCRFIVTDIEGEVSVSHNGVVKRAWLQGQTEFYMDFVADGSSDEVSLIWSVGVTSGDVVLDRFELIEYPPIYKSVALSATAQADNFANCYVFHNAFIRKLGTHDNLAAMEYVETTYNTSATYSMAQSFALHNDGSSINAYVRLDVPNADDMNNRPVDITATDNPNLHRLYVGDGQRSDGLILTGNDCEHSDLLIRGYTRNLLAGGDRTTHSNMRFWVGWLGVQGDGVQGRMTGPRAYGGVVIPRCPYSFQHFKGSGLTWRWTMKGQAFSFLPTCDGMQVTDAYCEWTVDVFMGDGKNVTVQNFFLKGVLDDTTQVSGDFENGSLLDGEIWGAGPTRDGTGNPASLARDQFRMESVIVDNTVFQTFQIINAQELYGPDYIAGDTGERYSRFMGAHGSFSLPRPMQIKNCTLVANTGGQANGDMGIGHLGPIDVTETQSSLINCVIDRTGAHPQGFVDPRSTNFAQNWYPESGQHLDGNLCNSPDETTLRFALRNDGSQFPVLGGDWFSGLEEVFVDAEVNAASTAAIGVPWCANCEDGDAKLDDWYASHNSAAALSAAQDVAGDFADLPAKTYRGAVELASRPWHARFAQLDIDAANDRCMLNPTLRKLTKNRYDDAGAYTTGTVSAMLAAADNFVQTNPGGTFGLDSGFQIDGFLQDLGYSNDIVTGMAILVKLFVDGETNVTLDGYFHFRNSNVSSGYFTQSGNVRTRNANIQVDALPQMVPGANYLGVSVQVGGNRVIYHNGTTTLDAASNYDGRRYTTLEIGKSVAGSRHAGARIDRFAAYIDQSLTPDEMRAIFRGF